MLKISIIIPTYNCGNYIEDAIESVLCQTYRNFEIIIVDDGSTDNTREIVKRYKVSYPQQIKYIYQQNKGASASRNRAIQEATGEFIALLDADDELVPHTLEKCINALSSSGAEWCISDLWHIENGIKEVFKSEVPNERYLYNILICDFIRRTPMFFKKSLLDIGLYDERLKARVDWDLNIRLIKAGKKFIYINEPLYIYKIRKKSIIKNNYEQSLYYTLQLLIKHHKKMADLRN